MSDSLTDKETIDEFFNQLEILFSIRMNEYFRKYKNETDFFNQFVICPKDYEDQNDILDEVISARKHFEANLAINIYDIHLSSIIINSEKQIEYYFHIFPTFLHMNDIDDIEICFVNNKIIPCGNAPYEILSRQARDIIVKAVKDIKGEISLGSLKRN